MNARITILALSSAALLAAGCGGDGGGDAKEKVSAKDRIAACADKQPSMTKDACEEAEKEGVLEDDGTHEGMDNAG